MSDTAVRPVGFNESVQVAGANFTSVVGQSEGTRAYRHSLPRPVPKRPEHLCTAKGNTCGAPKAKGSDLCIGHLRSAQKAEVTDAAE